MTYCIGHLAQNFKVNNSTDTKNTLKVISKFWQAATLICLVQIFAAR